MNTKKIFLLKLFVIVTLVFSPIDLQSVIAESEPTWSSNIVVYNPSYMSNISFNVIFYSNSSPDTIPTTLQVIRPHESRSLLVGGIFPDNTFKGGAVVSSDDQIIAVYRQNDPESSPIVYTSFGIEEAGESVFFIPFVQRNYTDGYSSQVIIQNISPTEISIDLNFIDLNGNSILVPLSDPDDNILPNSSKSYDLTDISALGNNFLGSLMITVEGVEAKKIVALVKNISSQTNQAYSYQGSATGNVDGSFFPIVSCNYGRTQLATKIFVQNTDPSETINEIQITYTKADGTQAIWSKILSNSLSRGESAELDICGEAPNVQGENFSAKVIGRNGSVNSIPMAVVASTSDSTGLLTAVNGVKLLEESKDKGSDAIYRAVIPYVEWSSSDFGYKTYLAVMNTGEYPATSVTAFYYYENGTQAVQHQLASQSNQMQTYVTRSTNPSTAPNLLTGNAISFKGAVVIESDQPIAVVARVQQVSKTGNVYKNQGDDYIAISYKKP